MRPLVNRVEQDPKDSKRKFCQSMVIWGKVTRDAKLEYTKGSDAAPPKPKVTFGVAYGDKGAETDKKFMNCISIGECYQTDLAQRVHAGDYVLIAGRWSSKEYTNKDGEQRTWNELRIEHIEILSDGFREAVVDAMTTAMSKILTLGRYDEKRDFVKAFNLSFVDAFWSLCQEMQGEAPEESAEEDGYGADDYEMTI